MCTAKKNSRRAVEPAYDKPGSPPWPLGRLAHLSRRGGMPKSQLVEGTGFLSCFGSAGVRPWCRPKATCCSKMYVSFVANLVLKICAAISPSACVLYPSCMNRIEELQLKLLQAENNFVDAALNTWSWNIQSKVSRTVLRLEGLNASCMLLTEFDIVQYM